MTTFTDLPTPSVEYTYTWFGTDGPRAVAVERGRDVDKRPVALTKLTITEFPGSDEAPVINAHGYILTKAGERDRRQGYSTLAWIDDEAALAAHVAAKATVR